MNIQEIKTFLKVPELRFTIDKTLEGAPTDWFSTWINADRISISAHKDMIAKLAASSNLSLKKEIKASKESGEIYTKYIIVEYATKADATF